MNGFDDIYNLAYNIIHRKFFKPKAKNSCLNVKLAYNFLTNLIKSLHNMPFS